MAEQPLGGCLARQLRRAARIGAQRLAVSLPCLVLVIAALFIILQFAPGDAVDALVSAVGGGDAGLADALRRQYGLNDPTPIRLMIYFWHLLHFDLGQSPIYGGPVLGVILQRLPVTLLLMGCSLSLAVTGGAALGVLAAWRVHRWPDRLISLLAVIVYATPSFWFGLMGIVLFAVKLGWLPAGGLSDVRANYHGARLVLDVAAHLILPVATLALIFLATYVRVMRASLLEVLGQDFIRTARAKGLREAAVVVRHALRNALLPLVTIAGLQASTMLGGAVVVESVFALPGVGLLAYESVVNRDLNMLLAIILMSALLVIAVNLAVDLLYGRLDPRIDA
jgi:peptide/nickel transport system permease protein